MNLFYNCIPFAAVLVAQTEGLDTKLAVYGPMGVICAWLMLRDEKRARDNEKLRETIAEVGHQMRSLSRSLLYITATHGPEGLREVAAKELERMPS